MKGWLATGALVAAVLLGALAYIALDRQIHEGVINLNLSLIAVIGGLFVICAIVFLVLRRKKAN
jgi:hypothetical protein